MNSVQIDACMSFKMLSESLRLHRADHSQHAQIAAGNILTNLASHEGMPLILEEQASTVRIASCCVLWTSGYLEEIVAFSLCREVELDGSRMISPAQSVFQHITGNLVKVLFWICVSMQSHVGQYLRVNLH